LNADIAKEVEEGHQEKAQSGDRLLVTDSTITAGTFVVSDIKHETIKAPAQQSAEKALGAESNPKVIDAAEVCDNTVGTKVGANGDVAAEESILEVPSQF
jgi:hypothetical protein